MAYQVATTALTLNDLKDHLPVVGFFKCNPSNICAAFYTISTDSGFLFNAHVNVHVRSILRAEKVGDRGSTHTFSVIRVARCYRSVW